MIKRLLPFLPPTVPPHIAPGKPRVEWSSLLGHPETLEELGVTGGTTTHRSKGPLWLHTDGQSTMILERDEPAPAVLPFLELMRDGTPMGYLGLDAADHLCWIADDGTTVFATFAPDLPAAFERDAAPAVLPIVALRRGGVSHGYLGVTAGDELAVIAPDGATVVAYVVGADTWRAADKVQAVRYLDDNGDQVVGVQQPAILDAVGTAGGGISHASADPVPAADFDALVDDYNLLASDVVALAVNYNTLLATLRTHGLIAP